MIACTLTKHLKSGKMFVDSWWFIPKSKVNETKEKYPEAVIVDVSGIPESFYNDSSKFYYESGSLINSYGVITD